MNLIPEYGWRITKYNPAFRDERGAYQKDEWISFSDIGQSFDGEELTFEEYQKAEDAYVFTALHFLSEANLKSLKVISLETNAPKVKKSLLADIPYNPKQIKNEMDVSDKDLESICRLVLRDVFWCCLESASDFYIHFGWDYYMYVGSNVCSEEAINFGRAKNLFIEEMVSPYIPNVDD
jgi:hypothetical protein